MTTTLTRPHPGVRPAVAAVLDRITLSPDGTRAFIDGRAVRDRSVTAGARRTVAESALELRKQLAGAAYEVLHAGRPADAPDPPYHARDLAFEDQLRLAVPHPVRTVRLPVVTSDGSTLVVERDGVRVRMARPAPVAPDEPPRGPAGDAVSVTVPSHRAQLSPGFFVVDGTRSPDPAGPLLRVYVHLTSATTALPVWSDMLALLQDSAVRYRAKVLSAPALYPRHDALVVYLDHRDRHHVPAIADRVTGLPGVGAATPAFGRAIRPGVGVAWEPADPRPEYAGLSFGQHRAHVLVESLLDARDGDRPLGDILAERFAAANIDITTPHRNADSPPEPAT
ncbi:hypothetical protein FDO65_20600 [Nakamurella flava]|uniref:Uncharacterized protein n=1 Tax=Nakamurella flava TaxID=2576308 RepID=A0A4U6Q910_9ACTN|nr:T3SS effector HopA1 family protein [Nakamurella flava]TKV56363.1 hypothetical protein FDO65_20600 [Nakamurella flava]